MRLARQATAEAVGTALLVAIVVGSGIFAERLSPEDVGLQLLENSTATALGLVALILAFGPVSGAHFNPIVTLADLVVKGIDWTSAAVYIAAQIVGGCVGAIAARPPHAVNSSQRSNAAGPDILPCDGPNSRATALVLIRSVLRSVKISHRTIFPPGDPTQ